jgi:hypothetical protein
MCDKNAKMWPESPQCCPKMSASHIPNAEQFPVFCCGCCASLDCLHSLSIAGQWQRANGRPVAPGVVVVVPTRRVRAVGYVQQRLASCVPHPPHPQRLVLRMVQCQSG